MEQAVAASIYPAIVVAGYNRPDSMRRILASVAQATYPAGVDVPLIVSIDQSDKSDAVAAVAEELTWPYGAKTIRRFPERQGLRRHILQCGALSEQYGAVIILEDDLLVAPGFYDFVTQALTFYQDDARIAGVSLYSHAWNGYADKAFRPAYNGFDAYLGQYSISWGQCWTKQQWADFKAFYDKAQAAPLAEIDAVPAAATRWPDTSWGKYYVYYIASADRYYVVPYVSMSTNFSDAGQHAAAQDTAHQVPLSSAKTHAYRFPEPEQAVRYDIFFERMGLFVPGVDAKDVCVDLNGAKKGAQGKRFWLSTQALPYQTTATFGLRLRPIEANVEQAIAGDAIRLYDTHAPACRPDGGPMQRARLRYELYGFGWRTLLPYTVRETLRLGLGRLRRMLRLGGKA